MSHIEIRDFRGNEWYIDSDQDVACTQCPQCGRPMKVTVLAPSPKITHVIFRNEKGEAVLNIDTEAFPPLPTTGVPFSRCYFCGYLEPESKELV